MLHYSNIFIAVFLLGLTQAALAADPVDPFLDVTSTRAVPHLSSRTKVVLTYKQAIEKALENNNAIKQLRIGFRQSEIAYKNAWDTFYLPQLSINASSNSTYTLGSLPPAFSKAPIGTPIHGFPTTNVTLGLGSYTLFNFGKDFKTFENSRLQWVRQQQQLIEAIRSKRNEVTNLFFAYKAALEKLDATQRSVRVSEAIVDLIKSRVRLGKATVTEIKSSESDLGTAKINYNQNAGNTKSSLWRLNEILYDAVGTEYIIDEPVKFIPINISIREALQIYFEKSPEIRDSKLNLKSSQLNVELAELNQLPLPKIAISPLNVAFIGGYYDSNTSTTTQSGTNIDVSTSVSLTIPLIGAGGLFNHRTIESAKLSRDSADISYVMTATNGQINISSLYTQAKLLEATVENSRQVLESNAVVLDTLFKQLAKGSVNRLELRDALNQARAAELELQDSIISHLQAKLNLAQIIGLDHLPGDIY